MKRRSNRRSAALNRLPNAETPMDCAFSTPTHRRFRGASRPRTSFGPTSRIFSPFGSPPPMVAQGDEQAALEPAGGYTQLSARTHKILHFTRKYVIPPGSVFLMYSSIIEWGWCWTCIIEWSVCVKGFPGVSRSTGRAIHPKCLIYSDERRSSQAAARVVSLTSDGCTQARASDPTGPGEKCPPILWPSPVAPYTVSWKTGDRSV